MAVLPTRGNLIATKHSLELASTGYELMDRKRNILVREMMGLIDRAEALQSQIDVVFSEAYAALQQANISLGICDRVAESIDLDDSLQILVRSVMGVEIPTIRADEAPPALQYGLFQTSAALDDAMVKFNRAKELCRQLAELENTIYRLASAIRKTQKRANALKNIVIPGYTETVRLINEALEEKEREEFSRLKVIKNMKK